MSHDLASAVGAAAFWTFVAICVIAGAASSVMRNRETQKTIRQAIEKGQTLDPETLDRLMQTNRMMQAGPPPPQAAPQTRFGLITGGLVMLCIGAGLATMGWFISLDKPEALHPMLGVGSLVGLIGVALLVSSAFVGKSDGTGRG